MFLNQLFCAFGNVLRFRPKETGALHDFFNGLQRRSGQGVSSGILCEEDFGDDIYPLVGTLSGENSGDEQLERRLMLERAFNITSLR